MTKKQTQNTIQQPNKNTKQTNVILEIHENNMTYLPYKKYVLILLLIALTPLYTQSEDEKAKFINIDELCHLTKEENQSSQGWTRRRRFELLREGKKQEDIEGIIKKELEEKSKNKDVEDLNSKLDKYLEENDIELKTEVRGVIYNTLNHIKGKPEFKWHTLFEKQIIEEIVSHLQSLNQSKDVPQEDIELVSQNWKQWFITYNLDHCFKQLKNAPLEREKRLKEQAILKELQAKKKQLSALTSTMLKSKNVSESHAAYKEIFNREFNIQNQLENMPSDKKEAERKKIQLRYLNNIISKNSLIKKGNDEGMNLVLAAYDTLFYTGNDNCQIEIRKILQDIVQKKVDKLKDVCIAFIDTKKHLTDEEKIRLVDIELNIKQQLIHTPTDQIERENHLLHIVEADQMIRKDGIGVIDIYSRKIRELIIKEVTNQWEKWMYLPNLEKIKTIKHLRDLAEFNSMVDPLIDQYNEIKLMSVGSKIKRFKMSVMRAILKYQKEEDRIQTEYNEKILKAFDRQISKTKKDSTEQLSLIGYKERFLKWGLCPDTNNETIENEKEKILSKKVGIYDDFLEIYKKEQEKIDTALKKQASLKGFRKKESVELYNIFFEAESKYTQFGNKFSYAEIFIIKPKSYKKYENHDFHIMKVYADDKEITGFKPVKEGEKHFNSVKFPLYLGQKISIRVQRAPGEFFPNSKFSICIHINLSNGRSFILGNKNAWTEYTPVSDTNWHDSDGAKFKDITFDTKNSIYVTHKDGKKSYSYGMTYASQVYNTYFTTTVTPKNITLTHIPMTDGKDDEGDDKGNENKKNK